MMNRYFVLAAAMLPLSACSSLFAENSNSFFATPDAAGNLNELDNVSYSSNNVSPLTGNGYAYQVGGNDGDGLRGYAGIINGTGVTAPPTSGTASMSGSYALAGIANIYEYGSGYNQTTVAGTPFTDGGSITLTADYGAGTLTGSAGFSYPITVNGTISGTTLRGTVTYDGVTGPLEGLVGAIEAVGAFHGNSDTQLHAGGFIVN